MLRFKKATMISSADDFIAGDTSATASSARTSSSSSSTLTFMAPTSSVHADPISTAEQQQHEPRRISPATTIQAPSDSSISSVEESSTSDNIFSVAVRVPSVKIRSVVGESKNSSPGAQKAFQIQKKSESLIRSYYSTKAPIATVPTTILNNNDATNNNNKKRAASVVISDSSDSSTASSPLLEDSTPPRQDVQTASSNKRQRISNSSASSNSNLAPLSSSAANNIQHQPQQPHHHPSQPTIRLLAASQDTCHLNALHCFVRRNIEVFQATSKDVAAPSPGRKNRVMIGQVGLRCVHCRPSPGPTTVATTPGTNTGAKDETDDDDSDNDNDKSNNNKKKRVKRAVCYPSSISRVYTSVSDMKFDHFAHCPYLPPEVREEFDRLRKEYKRRSAGSGRDKSSSDSSVASSSSSYSASRSTSSSSRSTASYYYDSAVEVGMVDMDGGGIGLAPSCAGIGAFPASASASAAAASYGVKNATKSKSATPDNAVHSVPSKVDVRARAPSVAAAAISDAAAATASKTTAKASLLPLAPAPTLRLEAAQAPAAHISHIKLCQQQAESHASLPSSSSNIQPSSMICGNNSKNNNNKIFLAAEEDEQVLNPIHCFVRRNVEVFAATREDIAAPAPGRKNRVVVGQVGIRCVHCAHLAPRDRVKRAVCYPPNVSGIYHSVSNMKFDHFAVCRGLSPEARTEFQGLRAACGRRGGRSTTSSSRKSRGSTSSSTAQYYHDSALNLGLVDTQDGIRFRPDQAACLRAAAALTVAHAHHHQPPPPLPPSLEHRQGQYRQQAQQRLEAHALPPAQPLPSLGHGEMIGDGMSALIFAATKRAAENEAHLDLADACTNKLAV